MKNVILQSAIALVACLALASTATANPPKIFDYVAKETRAIDRGHFTQGLMIWNDALWVSSGLYGESFVARYDWPSMANRKVTQLPDQYFAEGLAELNGRIYVLTWRSQDLLVLDPNSMEIIETHPLLGEGWGVTSDGSQLWISDGTHRLAVWEDGKVKRTIEVTYDGKRVSRLNELEWINGEIWANVWLTDQIVRIDPTSGIITSIIDLRGLLPRRDRQRDTDVLNGIAVDPKTGAIWLGGKRWPSLFNVELIERITR
jgi:glutamine cyclotransferase